MRCTYEIEVRAKCPVAPVVDVYAFTIHSERMIEVEAIVGFFKRYAGASRGIYQEDLTRKCAEALGASVTSVGWHQNVKVTCEAP